MASKRETLEALFASGEPLETGTLVPLPAMPLLEEAKSTPKYSTAQAVEDSEVGVTETCEVSAVAVELDSLRVGDTITMPDGTTATITWIDPARKRLAIGKKRNKVFISFAKLKAAQSGKKVAAATESTRRTSNKEEGQTRAPEPVTLPADLPSGLRPYQLESVAFITRQGRGLIADEMGLGKQHPVDTHVLTPSGWTAIGDLRPGDFVIGSNGRETSVTGIFPQGVKPSYRVSFSDSSSVEAGPEHLWTVAYHVDGHGTWRELVLTTEQLRTRPAVNIPRSDGRPGKARNLRNTVLYLPLLSEPVTFAPGPALAIPPYTLGALIANGSLTQSSPQLTVGTVDLAEVLAHIREEGVTIGSTRTYGSATHVIIPKTIGHIREMGLAVLSGVKRIPGAYLRATPADRVALLHGLMDGDGSISQTHNKVAYHTTSHLLAQDVRELVEGLGGVASVREYDRSDEGKPTDFQVRLRLPHGILPFRLARKRDRFQPGSHALPCRTVTAVEYVRDVESVCISVDAADQLYATEHCILTHNTVSAIACIQPPAVVVCPSLLKVNWARHLSEWRPKLKVAIVDGIQPDRLTNAQRDADVVVLNYDILYAHVDWLRQRRNRTLISDESQLLKNLELQWDKTNRVFHPGKNSPRLAAAFYELQLGVPHLLLLTGSPLMNRTKELFPLLHMLNPEEWGSFIRFCERYCAGTWDWIRVRGGGTQKVLKCDGRSNSDELYQRINNVYMVRHLKAAVLQDLPPKQRGTITVSLTPEYAKEYRKARNEFVKWVHEHGGPEAAMRAQRALAINRLTQLRRISALGKCDAAVQWALDFYESTGRPLVVMAYHHEAFDLIAQGLETANAAHDAAVKAGRSPDISRPIRYDTITGAVAHGKRQKIIDAFQAGNLDVLLYSMDPKIAVGVTLTRSADLLMLERLWRPMDQLQAEDRLHRYGQKNHVQVTYLDAEGTIDSKLALLLMDKATTAAAVIDGHNLSADEAAQLVSGEMFDTDAGRHLLEEIVEDAMRPNRARAETAVPLYEPRVYSEDGSRFDGYVYDDDLESNPSDVTNLYLATALDSWGDPL